MKRRYRTTDRLIWIRSAVLVTFVILILVGIGVLLRHVPKMIESSVNSISQEVPGFQAESSISLQETVENSLKDAKGTYGVAIKHFTTGEVYEKNADREFLAASTYKVWIMAMIYEKLADGSLRESRRLTGDLGEMLLAYDISPAEAQQASGEVTATVSEAIEKMITISDNNTALLLTDYVGQPRVNAYLERIGLTNSAGGNGQPTTTPTDLLLFFELLHTGKLAKKEETEAMLAVLRRQTLNTIIPKYLPAGTPVAHKTGARELFSHDAGIVYAPTGSYAIVVMSESGIPFDADERMAKLSRDVYGYFETDIQRRSKNEEIREFVKTGVSSGFFVLAVLAITICIWVFIKTRSTTKAQPVLHTHHRKLRDDNLL